MFKKVRQGKKPRSRMVKQIRVTSTFIFVLQVACLLICVGVFIAHAYVDIKAEAEVQADACTSAIKKTNPSGISKEVLGVYQRYLSNPAAGLDSEAIDRIVQSNNYQELVSILDDFCTDDVDAVSLLTYNESTNELICVADVSQFDEEDESYVAAVFELPEAIMKQLAAEKTPKYASHTLFTPSKMIVSQGVRYLVEGNPSAGIVCVTYTDPKIVNNILAFVILYAAIMAVMLIFMLYYLHRRTMNLLVRPLNTITEEIRHYSKDRLAGSFERRHFAALDIRTHNEIEDLGETLARMELDEATYVKEMARITAEKEREEAELRMAARIQASALPSDFPAFPDRPEFQIYASMTPAREVGGDFYDFFLVDDDHLCMVIADVSDKGIPAAMFMMTSKTTIANHIMAGKSPARALTDANKAICANNKTGMFVTVWVGILEISTGKLTAANAGHEYPVIQRPRGKFSLYRDRHGIMVGSMSNARFTDYRMTLRPGSKLFVYTDGVPEATNATDEMFGLDRMVAALNEDTNAGPEDVLTNMHRAVSEFVHDAPQFDDLTMLCLEYKVKR